MLDEKSSRVQGVIASQLKIALSVEGFQTVIPELLALLADLTQTQILPTITEYLSMITPPDDRLRNPALLCSHGVGAGTLDLEYS